MSGLLLWNANIWINPKYPAKVDGSSLNTKPKILENYNTKRNTYPSSIISVITSGNLFRKERKAHEPIFLEISSPKSKVPPPEFLVKGIMILASSKIAVLEGKYYISSGQSVISEKPIKKKGYKLGDYIGDYQVETINKTSVTLTNDFGNSVTKKINQKSKTPIEKQGSILKYKPPKDPKKLPEKSEQKTQPLITSETISKLQQNKPMPKAMPQSTTVPRISGRPQYVRQRGLANISGANISKNKTQTDHPRISGR